MKTTEGAATAEATEITALQFASALLRQRRWILGLAAGGALVAAMLTWRGASHYTSSASFLARGSESSVSGLQALASRFGVAVPGAEAPQSPEFYAELLRSREVLRSTARTSYQPPNESGTRAGEPRTLVELYGIQGGSEEERMQRAADRLREAVTVRPEPATGIVRLRVRASSPWLARDLAERLLEQLNEFNLERRQSRAAAERAFIAARLSDVGTALRAAEDSLRRFLEQNRRYENSPELRFEHDRLERAVALQQELYVSLLQSHEQAKIDEVRNTPVITVMEPPLAPLRPNPRWALVRIALGFLLGGLVGAGIGLGREYLATARLRDPDEYRELADLGAAAVEEFRHPLRGLRRRSRTG